jgi:uncharacterized membrane protein
MEDYLRNYVVAFPVLVAIDALWFLGLTRGFYLSELASIARMKDGKFAPIMPAGLVAWASVAAGVVFFAVPHLSADSSALSALGWGGLMGLVIYAAYDMTNLSTLRDYSTKLTFIDIAWGGFLCAVTTLVVWLVAK